MTVPVKPAARHRSRLLLAVGCVAVAAILAVAGYRAWRLSPMDQLRRAAGRHPRRISARLSGGFAWTALQHMRGDGERRIVPDDVFAAAAEVIRFAEGSTTPEAQHSLSTAYFLLNDDRRAIEID